MEKESLKYLFTQMMDSMRNAQSTKSQMLQATSSIDKAHYKEAYKKHENRAKYYSDKIDKFGGTGLNMVQVTGERFVEVKPQFSANPFTVREKFVYYLQGLTEDEAKLIMKAQVIKNDLIENSLKFRTIEFRNYITI